MRKLGIAACFAFCVSILAFVVESQSPNGAYSSPPFNTTSGASIVAACGGTANSLIKINSAGTGCTNSTIVDNAAGVTVGSPTGGAQGAGTINASAVLENSVDVTAGCTTGCSYTVAYSDYVAPVTASSAAMTTSNVGQWVRFRNTTTKKLGNATVRVNTLSAGGHFSVAVYSISGNTLTQIWTTGSQSTAAVANIAVTPTPVTLQANTNYYIAWCADNTTALLAAPSNAGTYEQLGSTNPANTWGINPTDAGTAGVLPASASITNITNNTAVSFASIYATN